MLEIIDVLNQNAGVISLAFSFIVCVATVFYAILTSQLVRETRNMRALQTDPHISVRIESYEGHLGFVKFIVENTGPGPAYDLRLAVDPDFTMDMGQTLSSIGIFKYGLRYMAPKQIIDFYLTSLMGHTDDLAKPDTRFKFTVTAQYRTSLGEQINENYPIDFVHFLGQSSLGTPPLPAIARNMEKIAKAVEQLQSGYSRLKVITFDQRDMKREGKENAAQYKRLRAQAKAAASTKSEVVRKK